MQLNILNKTISFEIFLSELLLNRYTPEMKAKADLRFEMFYRGVYRFILLLDHNFYITKLSPDK